jgi:hypothetical protein
MRTARTISRVFVAALAVAASLTCASVPVVAQQAAPGDWSSTIQVRPQPSPPVAPPAPPPLKGTTLDAPASANTTVVARPTTESRTAGQVALVAYLTDDGAPLDQGVIWRIFSDKPGADGKPRLLSLHRDPAPQLRLEVGDYLVNVAYGRANLTRRLTIAAGKLVTEKFVINAGGLRVAATLANGDAVADNLVVYDVLSDERDQFGNRIPALTRARPGVVVRLNAGIYQVQSTYGDANAVVRGEVTVEPGKVTEATLVHSAAKVTFRLVARAGAEALADTQWSITSASNESVKESAGALPTHILAPGTYNVSARRLGQTFKQDFSLQAGDNVYVEVVATAQ